MMSNDLKVDNIAEILDGLSDEERKVAIEIFKQYSTEGRSDLFDTLKYADYDEIPVDIGTFLHDRNYLGNGLYDGEGRFTLFKYWEDKLHDIFPDNLSTRYNSLIFSGSIGLGKAQPLNSLVLCEHGYKKMRDLTLEDKVFGVDGKLHNIIGIFPQGKKKICKVTFKDRTSTLCCDEHLWTVYDKKRPYTYKNPITGKKGYNKELGYKQYTLTTKELLEKGLYTSNKLTKERRFSIPLCQPIEFEHKDVFIDPYLMGVLIGDGRLTTSSAMFATKDDEIKNSVEEIISPYGYKLASRGYCCYNIKRIQHKNSPNEYYNEIQRLGLNVRAEYKHIPIEYLYGDVETRISLLQGLLDTDGNITKQSLIQYCSSSETLKNDIITLVQSLGGIATFTTKIPYYKTTSGEKKAGQLAYIINIKLPKNIQPFRLSRKLERVSSKSIDPIRLIDSIEYIGEEECQCIYIDSDEHLYLTNDFIVTHNSTIAVICILYTLYRLLCMKDANTYYGMQPNEKLSIAFINNTLNNARGVALAKLNNLIQLSPWFMTNGTMAGSVNLIYRPKKNIEFVVASSNNQVIGRCLFASFTDEVNFGLSKDVEAQKKKQKDLLSAVDARMKSRFMRTLGDGTAYLPTLLILASSASSDQSFLANYIDEKRKNESKSTLIVEENQWTVDTRKDSPIKFYVAIGNKFLPNEIIPYKPRKSPKEPFEYEEGIIDRYRAKGYGLLQVPVGYLEGFTENLDTQLMDIAGIASSSSLKFISGDKLLQIKTKSYRNPFTKDIIEVGTAQDDLLQYANFFDLNAVSEEDKAKPLFIHLDMSKGSNNGDKTGIAGVWIDGRVNVPQLTATSEGIKIGENGQVSYDSNGADSSRNLRYKAAFSVAVRAPRGQQISFEKNINFIRWLRENGFNIKGVSMDTFQSGMVYQNLKNEGFKTIILSVDRLAAQPGSKTKICIPYHYFKSAIYEHRLILYDKCDLLTDEIIGLERLSDGHIDHTSAGINSKDIVDGLCGALFNASQYSEEYSYHYGDHLAAAIDVNTSSENERKTQMIADFQAELAKLYSDERKKQNEELQDYQDISDGIIII